MVESDLEPAHPIVVTLAARLEAIDALPGAKLRSPRIMPDETKLALTDCASHGLVRPVTFQAVSHCFLLLAWSKLNSGRVGPGRVPNDGFKATLLFEVVSFRANTDGAGQGGTSSLLAQSVREPE